MQVASFALRVTSVAFKKDPRGHKKKLQNLQVLDKFYLQVHSLHRDRPVVQALNGLSSAGMRGSMHELAIAHDQYYYGRSIQKKSKEKQNMLQLGRNTRQRVHRNFSSIQSEAVKLLTVMLISCI